MKRILKLITLGLLIPSIALADPELRREKNLATKIPFQIRNSSTGALISGATGLDCEYSQFADGTTPGTFADVAGTETEIATNTGLYYVPMTASEMNSDMVILQCKSSSTNAMTDVIYINTKYGTVLTNSSGQLDASTIQDTSFVPTGAFQAGSTTTSLVLAAAQNVINVGQQICVASGTCAQRCCEVTAYSGSSTDTATCALGCAPSAADTYVVGGIATSSGQVWDTTQSAHTNAGTFGKYLDRSVSTSGSSSPIRKW
jgi:hypothetical protein